MIDQILIKCGTYKMWYIHIKYTLGVYRYIIFHVIDRVKSGNDSLGQCIVELDQLNPDMGISGSFELSDLVSMVTFYLLACLI